VVESFGVPWADAEAIVRAGAPSVATILEAVTIPYARARSKPRWAEKTPAHLLHVPWILSLWPDARVLRIVRDPRAVANSLTETPFGPSTPVSAAYLWDRQDSLTADVLDGEPRVLTVRFEDLLADTEGRLRRVCEFIDEAFDARMLEPSEAARDLAPHGGEWKRRLGEPLDPSRVDAWRAELDAREQARVATICAEGMKRFGYHGAIDPTVRARLRLGMPALADSDVRLVLEQGADRGVVFDLVEDQRRGGRDRVVLWGAPGELRWTSGGRGAVLRSGRALVGARLRSRPMLWVARPIGRKPKRSIGERAGDLLARAFAKRVEPTDVVAQLTTRD
jgi:hypothetical protein